MLRKLIVLAVRRAQAEGDVCWIWDGHDKRAFKRFCPIWPDEWVGSKGHRYNAFPWWRPFNFMLHCWRPTTRKDEQMHDHPRWTVTIVLQGRLTEITPWSRRDLKPGSIVFRSRKSIHTFHIPEDQRGKIWTLFIVGPRLYKQNWYNIQRFDNGNLDADDFAKAT